MWCKFLVILVLIPVVFLAAPKIAVGFFDWPAGAGAAQKMQALKQEIVNLKTLVANSRSKKPITAQAYLAVNLEDDSVILEKNPNTVHSLASVAKLMNALVAVENIDTAKTITVTKKMLAPEGVSPSIFSGLNISAKNLLQASLTQSVNDASESLAYFIGKEKFLRLMNKKAKDIGMASTVYVDAHGLDQRSRSTAADMVKLLAYLRKNRPEILAMTKNNNFWLPNSAGVLLKFQNMNNFYSMSEFVGGKTGYLPQAKDSFAGIFEINGKPVAIAMLHSANYQADTFKIINQIKN